MDFNELTYHYKPHPWHFAGPIMTVLLGLGIINKSQEAGDWFVLIVLCVIAILWSIWIILAGIMQSLIEANYETTGKEYAPPEKREAIKETYYPSTQITKPDSKWMKWAISILGGRSLARENWVGTGKLFSRSEWDRKMDELTRIKVLRYANGITADNGYRVNGGGGYDYLRAMSEGRANLPLPRSGNVSEEVPQEPDLPTHEAAHEEGSGGGGFVDSAAIMDEYLNRGIYKQEGQDHD